MEPECTFEVFVNEDLDNGKCVAVMIGNATIVEDEDGNLRPIIGLTPDMAMKAAEALVHCAGEVVRGFQE